MGSVILFYYFVKRLGYNKNIAFTSTILFSCSFTMLVIGTGCMTDAGAYFFSILILYYALNPIKSHWKSIEKENSILEYFSFKHYIIMGLLTAIGNLIRETVIFTTLAIFIYIFFESFTTINKGKSTQLMLKHLSFSVISLLISISFSLMWIVFWMRVSLLDFRTANVSPFMFIDQEVIEHLLFIILISFTLNYLFLFVGFIKENNKKRIDIFVIYSLVMIIPNIMQFYALPFSLYPQYRVIFMLFPFFLPISGLGVHELCEIFEKKVYLKNLNRYSWYWIFLGFYVLINFILGIPYMNELIIDLILMLFHL